MKEDTKMTARENYLKLLHHEPIQEFITLFPSVTILMQPSVTADIPLTPDDTEALSDANGSLKSPTVLLYPILTRRGFWRIFVIGEMSSNGQMSNQWTGKRLRTATGQIK